MNKAPLFQPAPRPKPHSTGETAQKLSEATQDLGFTRASKPPSDKKVENPRTQEPKSPIASQSKGVGLKLEIPDPVYTALRQEALNRRVTVRYLVLEALAAKGYAVDLMTVPEDGRRIR